MPKRKRCQDNGQDQTTKRTTTLTQPTVNVICTPPGFLTQPWDPPLSPEANPDALMDTQLHRIINWYLSIGVTPSPKKSRSAHQASCGNRHHSTCMNQRSNGTPTIPSTKLFSRLWRSGPDITRRLDVHGLIIRSSKAWIHRVRNVLIFLLLMRSITRYYNI